MAQLDREKRAALHSGEYVTDYARLHYKRMGRLMDRIELPPGAAVADFGCGSALALDHIKDKADEYIGVDFSADFISIAEGRARDMGAINATFYSGAISDFSAANPSKFDAVLALDLSEHVYDDEWQTVVQDAWTILKPGGRVYLHTPNREFFLERMKDRNFILKQFPQHIAVRTPKGNAAFFKRAGFTDIQIDLIPHYNILRHLHWLSGLPLIGPWFSARIFLTAHKPHA